MNEYHQQAADFLAKYGIIFSYKLANTKKPFWHSNHSDHQCNHFVVTFKQGKKRMSLDYFDSNYNFRNGILELRAYDVLANLSSEYYCADKFEEFCSEYGLDEDSRKAEKLFNACSKMSKKLQKFFDTPEIRDDLLEIR